MKKVALLTVIALTMVSAVFAGIASAEVNIADVEKVTLGPGGSVIVSGTAQCVEGTTINIGVIVRQRSAGGVFNRGGDSIFLQCSTTGPTSWTLGPAFSSFEDNRPFHAGPASVEMFATTDTALEREVTAVKISK